MRVVKNEVLGFEVLQGDCVEGLQSMGRSSTDVILTDPPYCSGGREATKSTRGSMLRSVDAEEWFGSDSMSVQGFKSLMRSCALEWNRILKPGGHVLAFIDWRMVPHLCEAIESADFLHRGLIVWDKTYFGMGSHYRLQHELVVLFSKGKPRKAERKNVGNVIQCKPIRGGEHPTQKPVPLLRQLLSVVSSPGDHVVDCFNGSGSTGVAAVMQGCTYAGVEREPKYVDLTEHRITNLHKEDWSTL